VIRFCRQLKIEESMKKLPRVLAALAAVGLLSTGCSAATGSPPAPSASAEKPIVVTVDDTFALPDGRKLAVRCWGEGAVTVFYDSGTGSSGIHDFPDGSPLLNLARDTRLCTYDRAGLGGSDPAPDHARTIDDLVDDMHNLLAAAALPGPYILVGWSGGGFDVYHFAGRYPGEVAGIVMVDVPAPQADIPMSEVPAVDGSDNPEHMDYVGFEHQMAVNRLPIPAVPVTVLTASDGESASPDEQLLWLEGSSNPVQTLIHSGHYIPGEKPLAIVTAVLAILKTI
jgi:pimeloyl-ACP methyl ester carboxylesterase